MDHSWFVSMWNNKRKTQRKLNKQLSVSWNPETRDPHKACYHQRKVKQRHLWSKGWTTRPETDTDTCTQSIGLVYL